VADARSPKPAYAMVIPPPNVTGVLTLGHVLNNTIQDILARKARMDGKEVLWLPGTDHAGIATQAVVERALRKQGVLRHREDLGREKFLAKVWEWKEKHGGIIIEQLKRLGASCDWTRERFTMDEAYSRCVQRVFVDLYRKGLIYRGKRMVNWDPAARTALSDEEVVMTEEQGHLWHIKYPLLDPAGQSQTGQYLIVATTRPETMLGDEAVAVHPHDERYQRLVGRRALLPLRNKPIPIIADELVDPKFGTGCVKVTPAHDRADYEMAVRHQLPFTVVIAPNGAMTGEAGEGFVGLDRFEARKAVVEHLQQQGLLVKVEPYVHNVGYSDRSQAPIEPYLSEQWFLRYPSAARSAAAVERGEIRFFPDRWAKTYAHWMENLKDWCISRQLWWGHRVPVWTKPDADPPEAERWKARVAQDGGASTMQYSEGVIRVATVSGDLRQALEAGGFAQDPDVLDTWCSSWLWPFATMGWPEQTETLRKFYPTTDLVTGPDIIFFWVARMIMAGYECVGEKPFAHVYFTGIIRDKLGRKMSKSLGNSPDPLDLIAKYGADALRFGVMRSAPLGQDVLYDEQQVELGRNFCNKLWNACRFRQLQGGATEGEIAPALLTSDDKWILQRLDTAIREITAAFAEYKFNEAVQTLYRFFWSEYCDWYIEASKAAFQGAEPARQANTLAVIDFVLSHALRLFHPFLPFITEELWHGLGYHEDLPAGQGGDTIMYAHWPKPLDAAFKEHYGLDETNEQLVAAKHELVTLGRDLRRQFGLPSNQKVKFVLQPAGPLPPHEAEVMKLLLYAETLEVTASAVLPKGTPKVANTLGELFLPLAGVIDAGVERARRQKELQKAQAEIEKAQTKLANPNFAQKVPPHVLAEHQRRLAEWEGKAEQARAALANLPD
jgi:valyl-tRNA synthetase